MGESFSDDRFRQKVKKPSSIERLRELVSGFKKKKPAPTAPTTETTEAPTTETAKTPKKTAPPTTGLPQYGKLRTAMEVLEKEEKAPTAPTAESDKAP